MSPGGLLDLAVHTPQGFLQADGVHRGGRVVPKGLIAALGADENPQMPDTSVRTGSALEEADAFVHSHWPFGTARPDLASLLEGR
jgi:hypothetical protein